MSFFKKVPLYPADPIFGLNTQFGEDKREKKVNLTVGIYNDEKLFPKKLSVVEKVEPMIPSLCTTAQYLPIFGLATYIETTGKLVLGDFWDAERERIFAAQGLGGTGALRVIGDFIQRELKVPLYLPDPTWPNHNQIFNVAGLKVEKYPYYNQGYDHEGVLAFLGAIEPGSVVLFHASCHNPTGADPTTEQWKELSALFKEKKLLPFFDLAYHGLGTSPEKDVESIRIFAEDGHEMFIAVTHSKSFGMYCERVGHLTIISESAERANHVKTSVRTIIRANYSNPPSYGARLIATILSDASLYSHWEQDLARMRDRIYKMQTQFADSLSKKCPNIDFGFLREKKGLFAYTGLTKEQANTLVKDHGVYIPSNGRVNVTRLSEDNLEYVTDCMASVMQSN